MSRSSVTTSQGETSSLEFGHYLTLLRRRWWVVALCTVLGILAALAYLVTANREVTARTVANINVISSDPFSQPKSAAEMIDADTEAQLATSSEVLQAAAASIGSGTTPSDVRSRSTVTLVPNTTVVKVTYAAPSRAEAEKGADAVAQAYIDFRSQQASNRVTSIVDQLRQRQDSLRNDLVRINTIIRDSGGQTSRAVQAESDRQLISIQMDSLSTQLDTFLGLDTTGGTILTPAAQNPTLISPSKSLVLSTGLALGLIIGVIAAMALGSADRRVRDEYDVRRLGGGRVLGQLHSKRGEVPATGQDADVIRSVRELLLATLPEAPPAVAIADLTEGSVGGDVAVNLAQAVVETGRKVSLVLPDASTAFVDSAVQA